MKRYRIQLPDKEMCIEPEEALIIFETANIALKNKQMFDYIAEEMDINELDLQNLSEKLNSQLNS